MTKCIRCGGAVLPSWVVDDTTLERIAACTQCGEEYELSGPQGRPPALSYCEAATIRLLLQQGARPWELQEAFGCASSTLYAIREGKYRGYTERASGAA